MNNENKKEKELVKLAAQYTAYNMVSNKLYLYAVGEYSKTDDSLVNILQISIEASNEKAALFELIDRVTEYNNASKHTVRQIA
jgi:hypothetical protein